jgi:hypothetical protein
MKKDNQKYQANQYDKIIKENIEVVIPNFVQNILDIHIIESEEIPDDIQHTKERKPDVLKKVKDDKGNVFILQIEFQVADEQEMVYRMGDYYLMLERKYKVPVEQYVIFIGNGKPTMPTVLQRKRIQFEFPLIIFSEIDYHEFLNSDKPEEIIFGVLGNFARETPEKALNQIINRLHETTKGDFALRKYFKQLRILSQLRKLEKQLKEIIMDSIEKYIDEERDVAFMIGAEKKSNEKDEKFVTNLLTKSNHTLAEIADFANVSIDFVIKIQQKLAGKK